MLDKFFVWVGRNRHPIGFTVGGLNILASLSHLVTGSWGLAVLWFIMGAYIVYDTARMP